MWSLLVSPFLDFSVTVTVIYPSFSNYSTFSTDKLFMAYMTNLEYIFPYSLNLRFNSLCLGVAFLSTNYKKLGSNKTLSAFTSYSI